WVYSHRSAGPIEPQTVVPLTSYPGSERSPSFSPDGNQVAFGWNGENQDNFDIYVRLVDGGTPLRLTTDAAADVSPAWSPDGRHIAFLRRSHIGAAIMLISPLGGPERKLTDLSWADWNHDLAWTPDSQFLAFTDRSSNREPFSIVLISLASAEKRRLTSPPQGSLGDHSFAFSPDGRTLAFAREETFSLGSDLYL